MTQATLPPIRVSQEVKDAWQAYSARHRVSYSMFVQSAIRAALHAEGLLPDRRKKERKTK